MRAVTKHSETCFDIPGRSATPQEPRRPGHRKGRGEAEERLGDNLLDEMRRVLSKAWQLLDTAESEGDHRGVVVALREVRECLESLGAMLARVQSPAGRPNLAQVLEAAKRRVAGAEGGAIIHTIRFGDGKRDE